MRAPEFPQNLTWINTAPLTIESLRGKAVLIDFWTYSCVNCIRTLPHLKKWHVRYADLGLVIVGVHAPEFAFEKDEQNVRDAVKKFGLEYPIVLDSDHDIWDLYANNVWPRKFLINAEGTIVYDHAGEGAYGKTEREIQNVIRAIHKDVPLPAIENEEGSGGVCYPATPETYLGYVRGREGKAGEKNQWHVQGAWKQEPEYIEYTGGEEGGELVINFEAVEVNLVMEASQKTDVEILYNDMPQQTISVHEPRMYHLLSAHHNTDDHKLFSGNLALRVRSPGFRAYAFTFGGCT